MLKTLINFIKNDTRKFFERFAIAMIVATFFETMYFIDSGNTFVMFNYFYPALAILVGVFVFLPIYTIIDGTSFFFTSVIELSGYLGLSIILSIFVGYIYIAGNLIVHGKLPSKENNYCYGSSYNSKKHSSFEDLVEERIIELETENSYESGINSYSLFGSGFSDSSDSYSSESSSSSSSSSDF